MKVKINSKKINQVVNAGKKAKVKYEKVSKNKQNPVITNRFEKKIKIFLASSKELVEDRREFEISLSRKNSDYIKHGIYYELVIWENFLDAMAPTRLQDEYNRAISKCDVFVILFSTKVGKYTYEEFNTAYTNFIATGKPLIFIYSKNPIELESNQGNNSSKEFKKKISSLGHFFTVYENTEGLLYHFSNQLVKLELRGT